MSTNDRNSPGHTPTNRRTERKTSRKTPRFALVGLLVLLISAGALIISQLAPTLLPSVLPSDNPLNGEPSDDGVFFEGIYVDDISLGGLTKENARQQIEARQTEYVQSTGVTVAYGTETQYYAIADTQYSYDTEAVLEDAWNRGRTGTAQERKAFLAALADSPVKLYTTPNIDPSALEQTIRTSAAAYATPAVDASFLDHDHTKPDGEHMSFSADVPGEQVDGDALWDEVKSAFINRTFGTVQMKMVPAQAEVTLEDLQARMLPVASFRSPILDFTAPRLTNIELSSAAVNGKVLQPGEQMSFNDTTGERSAAKGYKVAGIINSGVPDTGLGGGVCQVSGTLWNVVIRGDLEIVTRLNHSLKSSYLNPGEDATVDYGRKDFIFKNNKSTPVMVFMYVTKQSSKYYLNAEVYGVPLEEGATIELESVRTKTVAAPTGEARYVPSNKVARGKTETVKAKRGEYYTTYKIIKKDGKEISRSKLHESYYPASGLTIMYNPADGKPTPTPSPTPAPTAAASSAAAPTTPPTSAETAAPPATEAPQTTDGQ